MSLEVAIFEQSAKRTLAGSLALQRKIVYRVLKLVSLLQAYPPFAQVRSVRLRCPVLSASAVGCTRRIAGRYSVKCMSEDHVEEIASAESLRQLVEERLQSSEAANAACRLAGLSIRGNAAQKRGRLLQFISAG